MMAAEKNVSYFFFFFWIIYGVTVFSVGSDHICVVLIVAF